MCGFTCGVVHVYAPRTHNRKISTNLKCIASYSEAQNHDAVSGEGKITVELHDEGKIESKQHSVAVHNIFQLCKLL